MLEIMLLTVLQWGGAWGDTVIVRWLLQYLFAGSDMTLSLTDDVYWGLAGMRRYVPGYVMCAPLSEVNHCEC